MSALKEKKQDYLMHLTQVPSQARRFPMDLLRRGRCTIDCLGTSTSAAKYLLAKQESPRVYRVFVQSHTCVLQTSKAWSWLKLMSK